MKSKKICGPLLAIESSCDETAIAILAENGDVLADVIHTQVAEHAPFGGVVPEIASREHLVHIAALVERALNDAKLEAKDIRAVSATYGPGLIGALLVGLQFAKGFAQALNIPFVAVHHIKGHLLAASIDPNFVETIAADPFIALIASGGHSALYLYRDLDNIECIGETLDDAAGEAFDKSAKLLGLGYPGGQVIDELAKKGDPKAFAFPISLKDKKVFNYSFSGLKTSVKRQVEKIREAGTVIEGQLLWDICASLQYAIVEALMRKAILVCKNKKIYNLVLGGGVAANSLLRSEALRQGRNHRLKVYLPPKRLCTDNAVMIALVARKYLEKGLSSDFNIGPKPNLEIDTAFI